MNALVVEDNDTNYLLVKTILRKAGWTSDQAKTLSAFGSSVATQTYDLVILDVSLPDGDGLNYLERLRRHHPVPPVLVMTAHAFNEFRERATHVGAVGFFSKPFSLADFQATLKAFKAPPRSLAAPPPG